jgi:hypothetical protein
MRTFPTPLAAALCAASLATAYGQTVAPAPTTNKLLNSMSFNYDARQDKIGASNLQIKPSIVTSSATPTTGTIQVTININAVSHFSANTAYHCSLLAIGGILDTGNGTVAGGMESASRIAASGTPSATCTLTIPYSWTLPTDANADSGLVLVFAVAAVTGKGDSATVTRSTLQVDGIENLPANGATSTFAFNVTL